MSLLGTIISLAPVLVPLLLFIIGTAIGLAFLPALARIPGINVPGPAQEVTARILWTVSSLVHGRTVLDWSGETGYHLRGVVHREEVPADVDSDASWWFKRDGDWTPIEFGEDQWARFGKVPFGITFDPDTAFARMRADNVSGAQSDGGTRIVERGGLTGAVMDAADGISVAVANVTKRLGAAGGIEVAEHGEDVALMEFGGGGEASSKVIAAAMLFSLIAGAVCGYVVMVM